MYNMIINHSVIIIILRILTVIIWFFVFRWILLRILLLVASVDCYFDIRIWILMGCFFLLSLYKLLLFSWTTSNSAQLGIQIFYVVLFSSETTSLSKTIIPNIIKILNKSNFIITDCFKNLSIVISLSLTIMINCDISKKSRNNVNHINQIGFIFFKLLILSFKF